MKMASLFIGIALAAAAAPGAYTQAGGSSGPSQANDATVAAAPDVSVSLCTLSGDVRIRGWERGEVRARSDDDAKIELRRSDGTGAQAAATRLDVLVADRAKGVAADAQGGARCFSSIVELDVPRRAVVRIRTRDGDVDVAGIAEARVETVSGDVDVRGVAGAIEVTSFSGRVSLKDSSGRVRLSSVDGDIEAAEVRPAVEGDDFAAKSVSGEVVLDRVGHAQVRASAVSGSVLMRGPLARRGRYDLQTNSGNITLELPGDASFRIAARVTAGGAVTNEFPVRLTGRPGGAGLRMLNGKYGAGDATLSLASSRGKLRLRRIEK